MASMSLSAVMGAIVLSRRMSRGKAGGLCSRPLFIVSRRLGMFGQLEKRVMAPRKSRPAVAMPQIAARIGSFPRQQARGRARASCPGLRYAAPAAVPPEDLAERQVSRVRRRGRRFHRQRQLGRVGCEQLGKRSPHPGRTTPCGRPFPCREWRHRAARACGEFGAGAAGRVLAVFGCHPGRAARRSRRRLAPAAACPRPAGRWSAAVRAAPAARRSA
jgi:hypothetical protein